MSRLKSPAVIGMIAAAMTMLLANSGMADEQEDLQDKSTVYSRAAFGSFRAAQDTNRWQLDSGLMSNESLIDQRAGSEDLDDSYSGLRLRLPVGRQ